MLSKIFLPSSWKLTEYRYCVALVCAFASQKMKKVISPLRGNFVPIILIHNFYDILNNPIHNLALPTRYCWL
jgi:hypothetical protein